MKANYTIKYIKCQPKKHNKSFLGFFVFYAPNEAMQEYLLDHHEIIKEDEPEQKIKRQLPSDGLPLKEILVPARKTMIRKKGNPLPISFGGVIIAVMLLLVLTSANGQKKIEIAWSELNSTEETELLQVIDKYWDELNKRIDDVFAGKKITIKKIK